MDPVTENWTEIETSAIYEQLARILSSEQFASGKRQCRFLRYIVESTMEGRSSQLNQFKGGYRASIDICSSTDDESVNRITISQAPTKRLVGLSVAVFILGGAFAGFHYYSAPIPGSTNQSVTSERLSNDSIIERKNRQTSRSVIPAIAILPFENMSDDDQQMYFSDGITEDIITDLSIVSGMKFIARHSSFYYKNRSASIKEIAQALGVQYIVEGSVRKAGNRIRVNAQLIDVSTASHLWADRYDRDLEDIFAVQDDISRRVVGALHITLTDSENQRLGYHRTDDLEAYDYLLRAQEQFYTFSAEGIQNSIDLLNHSIDLDPDCAEALAWKSRVLVYAYIAGFKSSTQETIESALALSRQSVQKAEHLSMAHANFAWALRWDRKAEEAITEIELAIDLDPNFADAYLWKSLILSTDERGDESLAAVQKAIRLNPYYNVTYLFAVGRAHFVSGKLEDALQHFDRGIVKNSNFLPNHVYKLITLEQLGRDKATAAAR